MNFENLKEVDKDIFISCVRSIINECSSEKSFRLRQQAEALRKAIDNRMEEIEALKNDLIILNKMVDTFSNSDNPDSNTFFIIHLLKQQSLYLKDRIGEMRPDSWIKEKSKLETQAAEMDYRRSSAVRLEAQIH